MQMYEKAADWLAAGKNLRPVTLADDPLTKLIAFQGSDGTTHGITLANLKATVDELVGLERLLTPTPEGRLLLLNKDVPDLVPKV